MLFGDGAIGKELGLDEVLRGGPRDRTGGLIRRERSFHDGWWECKLFLTLCELQKLFCLLLSGSYFPGLKYFFSHTGKSVLKDRGVPLDLQLPPSWYSGPQILSILASLTSWCLLNSVRSRLRSGSLSLYRAVSSWEAGIIVGLILFEKHIVQDSDPLEKKINVWKPFNIFCLVLQLFTAEE